MPDNSGEYRILSWTRISKPFVPLRWNGKYPTSLKLSVKSPIFGFYGFSTCEKKEHGCGRWLLKKRYSHCKLWVRSVNPGTFILRDVLEFPAATFIFCGKVFGNSHSPSDKNKTYSLRKSVFFMNSPPLWSYRVYRTYGPYRTSSRSTRSFRLQYTYSPTTTS